jgi:hypothetical protein
MRHVFSRPSPVWRGVIMGTLASVGFGLVYFVVLDEPGSAYYLFATLAFLVGPLIGGIIAAWSTYEHKPRAFFASTSAAYGIVFVLFIFVYVVPPQFARENVQLPAYCDGFDGILDPPAPLAYLVPGIGTGILLAGDAETAVMAMIDTNGPPFPGTVYLVNRSDDKIIRSMRFGTDVISAAMDEGIVYIYNDKLGYLLDARTGEFEETILMIDNYGGLSESDLPVISRASTGHWYMETSAVISSWNIDGTVKSRPHLIFNGIARGCFIFGDTHEVSEL